MTLLRLVLILHNKENRISSRDTVAEINRSSKLENKLTSKVMRPAINYFISLWTTERTILIEIPLDSISKIHYNCRNYLA